MLTQVSNEAYRAMFKVAHSADWPVISRMLEDELSAIYEHMSLSHDEVKLRQMQGRAQFLREFMALARDATIVMEKLRESPL